jgi:hypothetical protein
MNNGEDKPPMNAVSLIRTFDRLNPGAGLGGDGFGEPLVGVGLGDDRTDGLGDGPGDVGVGEGDEGSGVGRADGSFEVQETRRSIPTTVAARALRFTR